MKTVFSLKERLKKDSAQVAEVQEVTLRKDYTLPGGLKGTHGLFGSDEWWSNIANGTAPVVRLEGTIEKVYFEGMHNDGRGFAMRNADGSTYAYSCVANDKRDLSLYKEGKRIVLTYVVEDLRNPIEVVGRPDERTSDTILEIAIDDAS